MFPLPIVPAIDLRNDLVVRGVAGNRAAYQPLDSSLIGSADPETVARWLVQTTQTNTLYVADLDAIEQGRPQWASILAIAHCARLWLDAGIGTSCQLGKLELFLSQNSIVADVVVGLESLTSSIDLNEIVARLEAERLIFSLDLCGGQLLTQIPAWASLSSIELVETLIKLGIRRFLLLDLAAVGMDAGVPTLELARQIRQRCPHVAMQLIGGGGVRSAADLQAMAEAGFDAALVASALHKGALLGPS